MQPVVRSRLLFLLQGGYYFLSGLWPVVHIDSFVRVTGPKTDLWLVRTVGLLIAAMGMHFLVSAPLGVARRDFLLPAVSALLLGWVDIYYVISGSILPVYLADAAMELILAVCWLQLLYVRRMDEKPVRAV
jgi:hypothetical protein